MIMIEMILTLFRRLGIAIRCLTDELIKAALKTVRDREEPISRRVVVLLFLSFLLYQVLMQTGLGLVGQVINVVGWVMAGLSALGIMVPLVVTLPLAGLLFLFLLFMSVRGYRPALQRLNTLEQEVESGHW